MGTPAGPPEHARVHVEPEPVDKVVPQERGSEIRAVDHEITAGLCLSGRRSPQAPTSCTIVEFQSAFSSVRENTKVTLS